MVLYADLVAFAILSHQIFFYLLITMYAVVQTGVRMDTGGRIFLPTLPLHLMLLQIIAWSSSIAGRLLSSASSSMSMLMSLTSDSSSFWLVVVGDSTMWMPLLLFFTELYSKLLYMLTDADDMFGNTILFPSGLRATFLLFGSVVVSNNTRWMTRRDRSYQWYHRFLLLLSAGRSIPCAQWHSWSVGKVLLH